MAEILGAATTATKFFFEVNAVSIDNWSFKCFYKVTTSILLACSVISTSKQFFGDPIQCDIRGGGVDKGVLNSYCWMYSTFNIPPNFKGSCAKREQDGSTLYNTYYQWVSIFLVIQALIFYLPRMLWLSMEGGLMKFLVRNARGKIIEDAEEKRDSLIQTFQEHLHNKYTKYAALFYFCETANLFVVISQIFVVNSFINYHFLSYGPKVWTYYSLPPEERIIQDLNPMCEAFPRIASCDFVRYGSGGEQEKKNALCILGLNMVNDKIFLIIWLWYFILLIIGSSRLVYRICTVCFWKYRYLLIKWKIRRYFQKNENDRHIGHYIEHCSLGDWLVLYQMSRNMNKRFFADFISVLSKTVNPHPVDECHEHHHFITDKTLDKVDAKEDSDSIRHLDITFIDKDVEDMKEKQVVGPKDLVDVLG
eukprot:GFUD01002633.1.p1 GENE.GFUD01002633.1~~GFUD01002633.1.p1  ORF type:complete len:421 (-),score=78.51 GFUD01002633.1:86-1348(-)